MWIPAVVVVIGLVMMAVELGAPGRTWPKVTWWWTRALSLNLVQAGIVWVIGWAWAKWMVDPSATSPEPGTWEVVAGAVGGYVVMTFVFYWWHRARHEIPWLWRWVHQVHHSPQRLEIITSFYKHPIEIALNAVLSLWVMYLVLGLSAPAAAGVTLLGGLGELFYHWNVRTPRWVGFLIQRPEAHCVHHEAGHHRHNYGDLPIWDILFGTFDNPTSFERECGFAEDAEHKLGPMLVGVDVQRGGASCGE